MEMHNVLDEPEPLIKLKKEEYTNEEEKRIIEILKRNGESMYISLLEFFCNKDVCDILIEMVKKGIIEVI